MGKATIISSYGAGSYLVQPEHNTAIAQARIIALTADNTTIDARLLTIDAEITSAEFDANFAADVLRAAISNSETAEQIEAKQRIALTKLTEFEQLKDRKSFLQLKKTANIKQITLLTQVTTPPTAVQAWCADYSESLAGVVATVEVGRRDTHPIIKPAGTAGTAAAHTTADGELFPLLSASPAATFYNYAMLPGAAKWKPRYRTGTASNVDTNTNTMTVTLDPLTIKGIVCNQASVLTSVPVVYMACNAEVFEDGDAVVVSYSGQWSTPTVVGFVAAPRRCDLELKIFGKQYPEKGIYENYTTINPANNQKTTISPPLSWGITVDSPSSDVPVLSVATGTDAEYRINLWMDAPGDYCGVATITCTDSADPPQTDFLKIYLPDNSAWQHESIETLIPDYFAGESDLNSNLAVHCCVNYDGLEIVPRVWKEIYGNNPAPILFPHTDGSRYQELVILQPSEVGFVDPAWAGRSGSSLYDACPPSPGPTQAEVWACFGSVDLGASPLPPSPDPAWYSGEEGGGHSGIVIARVWERYVCNP